MALDDSKYFSGVIYIDCSFIAEVLKRIGFFIIFKKYFLFIMGYVMGYFSHI